MRRARRAATFPAPVSGEHPSTERWWAWARGGRPPDAELEAHLATCHRCRQVVEELQPRRRRLGLQPLRSGLFRVAVALVLLGGLALALRQWVEPRCWGEANGPRSVWTAERRAALERRFDQRSGVAGSAAFAAFSAALDELQGRWAQARAEACAAPRASRATRLDCLDAQVKGVEVVLTLVETPDAAAVIDAPRAVRALPHPSECAEVAVTDDAKDPQRAAIAEGLAATRAASALGRPEQVVVQARRVAPLARLVGDEGALAEVTLLEGQALLEQGASAEAERSLLEAAALAERGGRPSLAATAWLKLARKVRRTAEQPRATLWLERAHAAAVRSADPLLAMEVRFAELRHRADLGPPAAVVDDAIALLAAAEKAAPDDERLLGFEAAVANLLVAADRPDEAVARYEAVLVRQRQRFGPASLAVGKSLLDLGGALGESGRPADALARVREGQAVLSRVLGPDAPALVPAYNNLALSALHELQFDEAKAAIDRAIALAIRHAGERSAQVARYRFNRATVMLRAGDAKEAALEAERALALGATLGQSERPETVEVLSTAAMAHRLNGDATRALERALQAKSLGERLVAGDDLRGRAATVLGLVQLEAGKAPEALAQLERALSFAVPREEAVEAATRELALAAALLANRQPAGRARALQDAALARLAGWKELPLENRALAERVARGLESKRTSAP